MKIDLAFDLGLWHFVVATDTSGNLASDGFDVGRHRLSIHLFENDIISRSARYLESVGSSQQRFELAPMTVESGSLRRPVERFFAPPSLAASARRPTSKFARRRSSRRLRKPPRIRPREAAGASGQAPRRRCPVACLRAPQYSPRRKLMREARHHCRASSTVKGAPGLHPSKGRL